MFYWTRGNESVSGLDTLQLAQYTVEDHYTSVSEAIYETGKLHSRPLCDVTCRAVNSSFSFTSSLSFCKNIYWLCPSPRPLPKAGFPLWAEEEHSVLYPGDIRPLEPSGGPFMGFLLDFPILCSSTYLYRYGANKCCFAQMWNVTEQMSHNFVLTLMWTLCIIIGSLFIFVLFHCLTESLNLNSDDFQTYSRCSWIRSTQTLKTTTRYSTTWPTRFFSSEVPHSSVLAVFAFSLSLSIFTNLKE